MDWQPQLDAFFALLLSMAILSMVLLCLALAQGLRESYGAILREDDRRREKERLERLTWHVGRDDGEDWQG